MQRVMLFTRQGSPIGELSPSEVFALTLVEKVNGEHSLSITTTRVLQQGQRILTCDARGKWREHVVYGTDAAHEAGMRPFGDYYCVWSLQADLMGTRVSAMPGVQAPVAASAALEAALGGTSRWAKGTVTNTATGGASMYDTDGWSAMSVLVQVWGGEIDAAIEVGSTGVTARKVDYPAKQGDQEPKRRYDFGADLRSIRRKVADGPLYCRMTPRGKGEETADGFYGRKVTIESVNQGRDYLENADMVPLAKLPDGSGGWEYPTIEAENPDCGTPAELLAWAQSVLEDYTVPKVTYSVDVMQLAREGVDLHGVSLGDAVQIVDRKFGDGIRTTGRVLEMRTNLLDDDDVQLTIGNVADDLASMFGGFGTRLEQVTTTVQAMNGGTMSTAEYLSRLLARINTEINADGGYTYITEGQGIRTYDAAVSDPLVGAEASAVVEIKGGTIRIANTKTAQGEWQWKTVFTSGHIAADLITAVNITSGYIGNASGSFWDLDNDILQLASTAEIGDRTVGEVLASIDATLSDARMQYAQNQSGTTAPTGGWSETPPTHLEGYWLWQRVAATYGAGDGAVTVYGTPKRVGLADEESYIASIAPQWYLSDSMEERTGGSWQSAQPSYASGKFIWMRSEYVWSDDPDPEHNIPVLVGAPNGSMRAVSDAYKVATNYLTFSAANGLDVGYAGTLAKTRISGGGVEIFNEAGQSALFAGLSGGYSLVRVGRASAGGNVVMSSAGYIDIRNQSLLMAHFGYGLGVDEEGTLSDAPYYDIGPRLANSTTGNWSAAIGYNNTASGYSAVAEGRNATASGSHAHAEGFYTEATAVDSHAEGSYSVASGNGSHAEGFTTLASGDHSHAQGITTIAAKTAQTAIGTYNVQDSETSTTHPSGTAAYGKYAVIVGNGTAANARRNALGLRWDGRVDMANGAGIWDTTDYDLHILTREMGLSQTEFRLDAAGRICVRTRTRASYTGTWGSWSGWEPAARLAVPTINRDGEIPSSSQYPNCLAITDADGERIGLIRVNRMATSGQMQLQIAVFNEKANGDEVSCSLFVVANRDGTTNVTWTGLDSGWQTLTLSSLFEQYNTGAANAPMYRRYGKTVEVIGVVKPTAGIPGSTSSARITTLPEGYRPHQNVYEVMQGGGINRWTLTINASTGDLGIQRYGSTAVADIPTGTWLPFHVVFTVD